MAQQKRLATTPVSLKPLERRITLDATGFLLRVFRYRAYRPSILGLPSTGVCQRLRYFDNA